LGQHYFGNWHDREILQAIESILETVSEEAFEMSFSFLPGILVNSVYLKLRPTARALRRLSNSTPFARNAQPIKLKQVFAVVKNNFLYQPNYCSARP
jgi:hypothetical protein